MPENLSIKALNHLHDSIFSPKVHAGHEKFLFLTMLMSYAISEQESDLVYSKVS